MGVTFVRGADARKLDEQRAAQQQQAFESATRLFRFWVPKGEEARIVFVDGELVDGVLDQPRYYEHSFFYNGTHNNFVMCLEKTHPGKGYKCPLCESGNKPYLIALFTIIDTRSFKGKENKVYKDTRKIFAAKPQTYELLQKLAQKRGGLAGCTFDAMRSTDSKSPQVGSSFDFVEKNPAADLVAKYTYTYEDREKKKHTDTKFKVADYEKEVVVKSEEEQRALGWGKPMQDIPTASSDVDGEPNYADQM